MKHDGVFLTLVRFRLMGMSEEQMLAYYPTLTRDRLEKAWDYYHAHKQEVDRIIQREACSEY